MLKNNIEVDVKVADLENVVDMMAHYLLELYKDDKQMTTSLKTEYIYAGEKFREIVLERYS